MPQVIGPGTCCLAAGMGSHGQRGHGNAGRWREPGLGHQEGRGQLRQGSGFYSGLHRDGGCGLGSTGCLVGAATGAKRGPGCHKGGGQRLWHRQGHGGGKGRAVLWFSHPGRPLAGVSRLPAGAAQGLSDSTQDPAHSPPLACTRHPHHEIEFIADSNTFKSIYCKITFQ